MQETQGAKINPILTGPGIDERYSRDDNGGRTYFLTDLLGSTRLLTDTNGNAVQRYDYDPYGTTTQSSTSYSNPYQYTGREHDQSGLYYYRARYYTPELGRFVSEDPLKLAAGPNSYAYVGGNPISYFDPYGRFGFAGAIIGAIGGAAAGYVSGGWQGAVAGGLVGGAVGIVAPWLAGAAGAAVGGEMAGMFAGTAVNVATGALGGLVGTVATNAVANATASGCQEKKGLLDGAAYGTTVGALAPLMSSEAFIVGSGIELGTLGESIFSGITGAFGTVGAATDPEAMHGFR